ncbi:hypothetical protein LCGC14_1257380, partial [marine sediment metagenome]
DVLFQTVKQGQTNFQDLAASAGDLAATAGVLNISLEENFSALAGLTKTAGSTSQAASQLDGIMRALIKPSGAMKVAFEGIGFATGEAAIGSLGLEETLRQLVGTTDGTTVGIGKLFTRAEGLRGLFSLMQDDFSELTEQMEGMETATDGLGASTDAFQEIQKSTQAQLDTLSNAFGRAGVAMGTNFLPALNGVIGGATKAVQLFTDLPGPVQATVAAMTLLGGVLATSAGLLLLMAPRIIATKAALATLTANSAFAATAIGGLTTALGILGTVLAGAAIGVAIGALLVKFTDLDERASKFFLNMLGVEDAATAGGSAMEGLADGIENTQIKLDFLLDVSDRYKTATGEVNEVIRVGINTGQDYDDILTKLAQSAQDGSEQNQILQGIMSEVSKEAGDATRALDDLEKTIAAMEAAEKAAAAATKKLADAMSALGVVTQADVEKKFENLEIVMREGVITTAQLERAVADLGTELKDNGLLVGENRDRLSELAAEIVRLGGVIPPALAVLLPFSDQIGILAEQSAAAALEQERLRQKILATLAAQQAGIGFIAPPGGETADTDFDLANAPGPGDGPDLGFIGGIKDQLKDFFERDFGAIMSDATDILANLFGVELPSFMQAGLNSIVKFMQGDWIGGILSGVSALVGGIKALFGKPEFKSVAEEVGRDLGVDISEALAKAIAEDAGRLGDRYAAITLNLAAIIREAGVTTAEEFASFTARARDSLVALEQGLLTSAEAAGVLKDALIGELIPSLSETGGSVEQVAEIFRAMAGQVESGLFDAAEAVDVLKEGIPALIDEIAEIGATADSIAGLNLALESVFATIATGALTAAQSADLLGTTIDSLVENLDELGPEGLVALNAAVGGVFDTFAAGAITADQATDILGDAFEALQSNLEDLGPAGAAAMLQIIEAARAAGLAIEPINDFIKDQLSVAIDATSTLLDSLTKRAQDFRDEFGIALSDAAGGIGQEGPFGSLTNNAFQAQEVLDGIRSGALTTAEALEFLGEQGIDLGDRLEEFAGNGERAIADFVRDTAKGLREGSKEFEDFERKAKFAAGTLFAAFTELQQQGTPVTEIVAMMGGEISQLKDIFKNELGGIPDELQPMFGFFRKLQKEGVQDTITEISAMGASVEALGATGLLTQDQFDLFTQSVKGGFRDLRDEGLGPKEALAALAPELQRIVDLQAAGAIEVDNQTQKLIDQAAAQGLVKEAGLDTTESIQAGFGGLFDRFDALLGSMGVVTDGFFQFGEAGDEATKKVGDGADREGKRLAESFAAATDVAAEGIVKLGTDGIEALTSLNDTAQEQAGEISEAIIDAATESEKEFAEKLAAVQDSLGDAAGDGKEQFGNLQSDGVDSALGIEKEYTDSMAAVSSALGNIADDGSDAFGIIADAAKSSVDDAIAEYERLERRLVGASILPDTADAAEDEFDRMGESGASSATNIADAYDDELGDASPFTAADAPVPFDAEQIAFGTAGATRGGITIENLIVQVSPEVLADPEALRALADRLRDLIQAADSDEMRARGERREQTAG